jgi:hypothetical protein
MPPAIAVLLNSVPTQQTGAASGILNTSRQIGGALAIALFGALLTPEHVARWLPVSNDLPGRDHERSRLQRARFRDRPLAIG